MIPISYKLLFEILSRNNSEELKSNNIVYFYEPSSLKSHGSSLLRENIRVFKKTNGYEIFYYFSGIKIFDTQVPYYISKLGDVL